MKLLIILVVMSGCYGTTKFSSISPVRPPWGMTQRSVADSLRPTFQWADKSSTGDTTYELGIWEWLGEGATRGERIYSKQGIVGTSYTLDVDLAPKTYYFWSVKRATDPNWATGDVFFMMLGVWIHDPNTFFSFVTPKQ